MMKKIAVTDIPRSTRPTMKLQAQIEEFVRSGWDACEIDTRHYCSAISCRNAWNTAIQRSHRTLVAIIRNGRVFVLRKEVKNELAKRT